MQGFVSGGKWSADGLRDHWENSGFELRRLRGHCVFLETPLLILVTTGWSSNTLHLTLKNCPIWGTQSYSYPSTKLGYWQETFTIEAGRGYSSLQCLCLWFWTWLWSWRTLATCIPLHLDFIASHQHLMRHCEDIATLAHMTASTQGQHPSSYILWSLEERVSLLKYHGFLQLLTTRLLFSPSSKEYWVFKEKK